MRSLEAGELHKLQERPHLFDSHRRAVAEVMYAELAQLEATARHGAPKAAASRHIGEVLLRLRAVLERLRLLTGENFVHVVESPGLLGVVEDLDALVANLVPLGATRVRIHDKHTGPEGGTGHVTAASPMVLVGDDMQQTLHNTRRGGRELVIVHEALGGKHVEALVNVSTARLCPVHNGATQLPALVNHSR